jgi:hypothetical protein
MALQDRLLLTICWMLVAMGLAQLSPFSDLLR